MRWESPWGEGYPGWHIECCAMSTDILGSTLDIHTGGEDNIFPHHECEIAQAEGATGEKFVRYWMHARFLLVDGRKMSKSLGNFYTLRDLMEKGHDPLDIRYSLLSTHYRQQLNLTMGGLGSAAQGRKRLHDFLVNMADVTKEENAGTVEETIAKARTAFCDALDDDLNISAGLGVVFDFVSDVNRAHPGKKEAALAADALRDFDRVLGVLNEGGEDDVPQEILDAVRAREDARRNKDFEGADRIRDELLEKGYVVEDTPDGPRCRPA
jgi:cysteinyl-tRNA synthetase